MRDYAHSGISVRRWKLFTAMALVALFLMPVNYRAGAARPHGHALIQLVYEAQAGIPVHHHSVDEAGVRHHGSDVASSHTGAPPIQVTATSALLPTILLALSLRTLRSSIRTISDTRPASRSLRPEPPPPRSD